jgi:hypothetical protein
VVLVVLAVWSVRHDPPSVPEQRDITRALPFLERGAGAMVAAADGDGRAVVLEDVDFDRGCRITPVRLGVQASREVTVYVRADQAPAALDAIAGALPAGFHARVRHSPTGMRHDLYADAGGFVAIDATAGFGDTVLTLRASTGCRPGAAGVDLSPTDPSAGGTPDAFLTALSALGGGPAGAAGREAPCPSGGVARTVMSGDLPAPPDLGRALEGVVATTAVVEADPRLWAYRDGGVSVVVTEADGRVRVFATTGCE